MKIDTWLALIIAGALCVITPPAVALVVTGLIVGLVNNWERISAR